MRIIDLDVREVEINSVLEGLLVEVASVVIYNIRKYGFSSCQYSASGESVREMHIRLDRVSKMTELFECSKLAPVIEDLKRRFRMARAEGQPHVIICSVREYFLIQLAYQQEYISDLGFSTRRYLVGRNALLVEELEALENWASSPEMLPLFNPQAIEIIHAIKNRFQEATS